MAYTVSFRYALVMCGSAQFKYSLCIKKTIFRLLPTLEYSCSKIFGQVYEETKMSTIKVTDADFQDTLQNNNLVLVDFWAPWCGPCRAIAPVLEEIASENSNVVIAKMNTDENPNTASQHGIMSIPTMMIFKNGELVDRLVGALPKPAIMEKLQPHF